VVDGYVRVSQVGYRRGERFISPVVQREQIEAWAAARDVDLLEIFEELDESGGRADRPLLEAAIRRIEAGVSHGLAVWKVDRFGRSLIDGLLVIERIRDAGGHFFSVQDGLDASTDTGRLVLRIMLSMAELELDRIRAGFAIANVKMIERGGYCGRFTPVGYQRTRAGRLRPDPVCAPVISELFGLRASGWSERRLCRWLEGHGVRTAKGNPAWLESTLSNLLRSHVYLGEVSWNGLVHEQAHPALVDPATWQLAQRPRQITATYSARPSLLAGLVRCAGCSMTLSATPRRDRDGERVRRHSCRGRSASGPCPAPASISTDYLEPYVETATLELLHRRRRAPRAQVEAAMQRLIEAQKGLASYRDSDRVLRTLGEQAFAAGLKARAQRVRDAQLDLAAVRAKHSLHTLPPAAELEATWPEMDLDDKREIIGSVIDAVFVARGRLDVEERITICPAGTAPRRLPRAGDKGNQARPFRPSQRIRTATAARPAYLWSRSRIERELRPFLRGRTSWPNRDELQAAGRARLHLQVVLREGEHWWAYRFGLSVDPGVARAAWTDERIRQTLALYLRDKTTWPTIAQFQADGLHSLRVAITASGGVARWSTEFPTVAPVQRRRPDRNWNENRIRRELVPFCRGRATFPTRKESRAAGRESLWTAMAYRGGIDRWANVVGLPRPSRRKDTGGSACVSAGQGSAVPAENPLRAPPDARASRPQPSPRHER